MNELAPVGHNNPPKDEFDIVLDEINDLYTEAKQWIDGDPIATQGQADSIDNLVKMIKEAAKRAEAHRKELVIPIDEAKQAVQERFNPLIGKPKADGSRGLTVRAIEACNAALTPWNNKIQAARDEQAGIARAKAAAERAAAEKAMQAANLEEREKAEAMLAKAQKAQGKARALEKDTVKGMRTIWEVKITDQTALLRHYWSTKAPKLNQFAEQLANADVRAGVRTIPGCEITSRKIAR